MEEAQTQNPNLTLNEQRPNPKTTRGRQKIEIKEIKQESKRQVTFSKRRRGLFKKAAELNVLCGAQIAILTFSRCGRIYTFGSSDVDALLDKYLNGDPVKIGEYSGSGDAEVSTEEPWWCRPVESIPEAELEEYVAAMGELRENVAARIRQMGDRTVENAPVGVNSTVANMSEYRPTWRNLTTENHGSVNLTVRNDRGHIMAFEDEGFEDQFLT
ncbi:PREDICTED: agamous-like MADS-box protein AGL29 [Tarenaya hassleriana]|uniref:agamous-like MADS-box protein AGL29 n=1 Tax=Tarenaya hassleriana TaxID=28532 RepID=UPI00053C47E0|nr:PREDICTED: agamous-like MADS-box protein AGL29 [Tarenaya hassleriana]